MHRISILRRKNCFAILPDNAIGNSNSYKENEIGMDNNIFHKGDKAIGKAGGGAQDVVERKKVITTFLKVIEEASEICYI